MFVYIRKYAFSKNVNYAFKISLAFIKSLVISTYGTPHFDCTYLAKEKLYECSINLNKFIESFIISSKFAKI